MQSSGAASSTAASCVVADGDVAARCALAAALERAGLTVAGTVQDTVSLLQLSVSVRPAVAVIDVDLMGGGVFATSKMTRQSPETSTVLLSSRIDQEQLFDALSAGAVGYLPKSTDPDRVAAAVLGVLDGEVALPRSMVARVVDELRGRPGRRLATPAANVAKLTSREWDVASLMRAGASTQQIAARLYMSTSTVRVHVSSILHKLHVPDRDSAIRVLAEA
jgi:DNA-binding NarL/FixJ family response regulator